MKSALWICILKLRIVARVLPKFRKQWEAHGRVDDLLHLDVNYSFRAGEGTHAVGIPVDRCATGELESAAGIEIDEQQSGMWIDREIAERIEHAVAIVVRECDVPRVEYPHEAGIATLVRDIRAALRIVSRD